MRDERGTGIVGTFFGAFTFLAFLALATHTMVSLYATSVLTAVAWDETRQAAQQGERTAAAEDSVRGRLSGFDDVDVVMETAPDGAVGMTVTAERPSLLPRGMAGHTELDRIERTVWVRNEELR